MDGALAALLALLAAGFQGGAAWVFAGQGRADPVHAASAFRHLYRLALRAAEATKIADRANRKSSEQADLRDAMTKLSVHLSWLEEGLIDAGEHWAQVHPQLRDGPVEDQMGSGQE